MSLCSIENICYFKCVSNWKFDITDLNLPLKKHIDETNRSLAILLIQDLLANRLDAAAVREHDTSQSPFSLEFSIAEEYKLLAISFISNCKFLEIYKQDGGYLLTSKGIGTKENKNLFDHEIAFSLPDLPNFHLKFLSLKSTWNQVEKGVAGDCVIRELKLMLELRENMFPKPFPTTSTQHDSCTTTTSENEDPMKIEISQLRHEIAALKYAATDPEAAKIPSYPAAQQPSQSLQVASILQSDAAILTIMSSLQCKLVQDFTSLLDQKLMPIISKLDKLEMKVDELRQSQSSSERTEEPMKSKSNVEESSVECENSQL